MEDKKYESMNPLDLAHEEDMARMERQVERSDKNANKWFIAWLITFLFLMATNFGWIVYESQFQDVVTTQTVKQDSGDGGSNEFIGGDYYGETDSNDNNESQGE